MTLRNASTMALLALLWTGCALVPEEPRVEENGKSIWRRVETKHFIVESNLSSDEKLLDIACEFETLWHAYVSVPILGMKPPREKSLVIVPRSMSEFRYIFAPPYTGLYVKETLLGPLIFLSPESRSFQEMTIKHELAHFVTSGSIHKAPTWLEEGLAQVMETARFDRRGGEVRFGEPLPGRHYPALERLPSEIFMAPWPANLSEDDLGVFYARSWALVHYLVDKRLKEFLKFLERLQKGEAWNAAWDQEIRLSRSDIDSEIDAYIRRGIYGIWMVQAYLPERDDYQVVPVPLADALALRSQLNRNATNTDRDRSQKLRASDQDLRAAYAIDPNSARVLTIKAAIEGGTYGGKKSRTDEGEIRVHLE